MGAMDDPKLIETLTRIEAKLDHLTETYTTHLKEHEDHETRIRALEKKVWAIPSMATVLALLAMALPYFLGH